MPQLSKASSEKFQAIMQALTNSLINGGAATVIGTSGYRWFRDNLDCAFCPADASSTPEQYGMMVVGSAYLLYWLALLINRRCGYRLTQEEYQDLLLQSQQAGAMPWLALASQIFFIAAAMMDAGALVSGGSLSNLGRTAETAYVSTLAGGFSATIPPVVYQHLRQKRCGESTTGTHLTVKDVAVPASVFAGWLFVIANLGVLFSRDVQPSGPGHNASDTTMLATTAQPMGDEVAKVIATAAFIITNWAVVAFLMTMLINILELAEACRARSVSQVDRTALLDVSGLSDETEHDVEEPFNRGNTTATDELEQKQDQNRSSGLAEGKDPYSDDEGSDVDDPLTRSQGLRTLR